MRSMVTEGMGRCMFTKLTRLENGATLRCFQKLNHMAEGSLRNINSPLDRIFSDKELKNKRLT
jgi:hypothetical protein